MNRFVYAATSAPAALMLATTALDHGAEVTVKTGAVVLAAGVVWRSVLVPVLFRPIGKALARGAAVEVKAFHDANVLPVLDRLDDGQATITRRLDQLGAQSAEVAHLVGLDRLE